MQCCAAVGKGAPRLRWAATGSLEFALKAVDRNNGALVAQFVALAGPPEGLFAAHITRSDEVRSSVLQCGGDEFAIRFRAAAIVANRW
jgi:hypothetical protein